MYATIAREIFSFWPSRQDGIAVFVSLSSESKLKPSIIIKFLPYNSRRKVS